jgi:hypothetical protein
MAEFREYYKLALRLAAMPGAGPTTGLGQPSPEPGV